MNNNWKIRQLSLIALISLTGIFNVKASDKINYRTPPQFIQHEASKYGIYDISKKIGVSPWYFWSNVPAKY